MPRFERDNLAFEQFFPLSPQIVKTSRFEAQKVCGQCIQTKAFWILNPFKFSFTNRFNSYIFLLAMSPVNVFINSLYDTSWPCAGIKTVRTKKTGSRRVRIICVPIVVRRLLSRIQTLNACVLAKWTGGFTQMISDFVIVATLWRGRGRNEREASATGRGFYDDGATVYFQSTDRTPEVARADTGRPARTYYFVTLSRRETAGWLSRAPQSLARACTPMSAPRRSSERTQRWRSNVTAHDIEI